MRKPLFMLIFILTCNIAYAQAQLPASSTPELPQDYKTWKGESKKLIIRDGLEVEKEIRALIDVPAKGTDKVLMIIRINNEIVFTELLESYPTPNDPNYDTNFRATLNWLTDKDYIKLSVGRTPTPELDEMVPLVWMTWDKFIKDKFNISDKEMEQLQRFCLL